MFWHTFLKVTERLEFLAVMINILLHSFSFHSYFIVPHHWAKSGLPVRFAHEEGLEKRPRKKLPHNLIPQRHSLVHKCVSYQQALIGVYLFVLHSCNYASQIILFLFWHTLFLEYFWVHSKNWIEGIETFYKNLCHLTPERCICCNWCTYTSLSPRAHSLHRGSFWGLFWQTCNGTYLPLQYHTGQFHCPKNPQGRASSFITPFSLSPGNHWSFCCRDSLLFPIFFFSSL